MTTGFILTAALWASAACCMLLALSGYAQMARAKGGWREAPAWTAPLVFTSASAALLTAAGVLGLAGVILTLVPLLVVAVKAARAWREIAGLKGHPAAARTVLGLLAGRLRDALWNAREDARDLLGMLRRTAAPAGEAAPPASRDGFVEGIAAAARHVPPLREDGRLGDAPPAASVAGSLDAAGTVVPPAFAALAEFVRDYDPDGDEDELLEFVAGCAAGVLVLAEGFEDLAETLLNDTGLDPAFAIGFVDAGDEVADLSGVFALLSYRYHEVYASIHEHVEAGGTLPKGDARGWFHAGGGTPGGAAA
jgi:hypothetical protein